MAEHRPIAWEIKKWDGLPANNPGHPLYTDQANAIKALGWLRDVEAAAGRLGQTPLQAMFDELYNYNGERGPLQFRGFDIGKQKPVDAYTQLMVNFGEGNWVNVGEDGEVWVASARKLTAMSAEERRAVRFVSVVTLGNAAYGIGSQGWKEETWTEVIIHEVGIHVMQDIETIRLWRQGSPWTTAYTYGELDHYVFRYRGTPRYIWWCNQIAEAKLGGILHALQEWNGKEAARYQEQPGFLTVNRFLKAETQLKEFKEKKTDVKLPGFNFGEAWLLAERFNPENRLPAQLGLVAAENPRDPPNPVVNMKESEHFVLQLGDELRKLFSDEPLAWWGREVRGQK